MGGVEIGHDNPRLYGWVLFVSSAYIIPDFYLNGHALCDNQYVGRKLFLTCGFFIIRIVFKENGAFDISRQAFV